jgi:DNA polymerase-3 subunit delta'
LLKTLEEPPKNVHIILGATSEFSILPTVRSRVKKLVIFPFTKSVLEKTLASECLDKERLADAIACGDGTLGKTLALYNDENLEKVMQLAQEILVDMQSSKDLLEYSERITQSKTDLTQLIEVLSLFVRDMLVSFENKPSLAFNKKVTERLLQAKGYTKGALVNILEDLVMATKRVQANGNKTMVQEWLLFKILEDKFKWQKL